MATENKEKILVIEDEALVARELEHRLTKMGWEVVGIAYGDDAIELAMETQPDLLLTDIHLKNGVDGIEVAQKICEEIDVPVVFLTAYSDDQTVAKAKLATPFGYIIKPVENRELQITIEMALYKFRIDKELKETQQLLQTALTCIGSALVFVDDAGRVLNVNKDAIRLLGNTDAIGRNCQDLLSLADGSSVLKTIDAALHEKGIARLSPFVIQVADQEMKLVDGIVGPMDAGGVLMLRELAEINDSVEMLGAPNDLLANLGSEALIPTESALCQMLISPYGVEGAEANKIIEKLSRQFDQHVRSTDLVSVFAGSLLSVSMPYTSILEGEQIAKTLLQEINSNVNIDEKIHFSIGLAYSTAGDKQPLELFRRTTVALNNARSAGGSNIVVWDEGLDEAIANRTSEIRMERESHNVVLLWNVMNVLSRAEDVETLSQGFCEHMFPFFNFTRIALLTRKNEALVTITGFVQGEGEVSSVAELNLSAAEFQLINSLLGDGSGFAEQDQTWLFGLGSERVLFLDPVDAKDRAQTDFLRTLVDYFSTGMSRFELLPDIDPTDDFFKVGDLVYRSPQLASIVESIRLVAPTDATVLITGDTGTGKEMFAKYLHDLSPRSDKPFIIVDCGAIVSSLIESELFGHVRGAFTGADKNFSGRLKEADGGTVLLDEIGELPLDVQIKLLRFVQNREIVAVGTTENLTVDTRVIAATNKDIKKMVEEGTFREDLYYRLNVFAIETPRLKDRHEDILLLAEHYLDLYSQRYGKRSLGFSRDAEQALLQYEWPGNVRELINVINRAVILCKDLSVNPIHLGLFSTTEEPPTAKPDGQTSLLERIRELVDCSLAMKPDLPPVGLWLEEDLILTSLEDNSRILSRAATSLGIPESTLRRKVGRLRDTYGSVLPERPKGWFDANRMLAELSGISKERRIPVLDLACQSLAKEIESRNLLRQDAATLMGVSVPTYRKLIG